MGTTVEERPHGATGFFRLLFGEQVAGALDSDYFGAGESFAEAGEDSAGKDALV